MLPKDDARMLFMQLILKEKKFLFSKTGQLISTDGSPPMEVTNDSKRARWALIGDRLVRAGALHYAGKTADELRATYCDMKRRTMDKLRRFEELLTGKDDKTRIQLNSRDNMMLDIIGRKSLPPTLRSMIDDQMPLLRQDNDDDSGPVQSPGSLEAQLKQEWADFELQQFENSVDDDQPPAPTTSRLLPPRSQSAVGHRHHLLYQLAGPSSATMTAEAITGSNDNSCDAIDLIHGDIPDSSNNNNIVIGGRKRMRRPMMDDGREQDEEDQQEQRIKKRKDDDTNDHRHMDELVQQERLRYFKSQADLNESKCQLIPEQIALARAQRMEAQMRTELLRAQLEHFQREQRSAQQLRLFDQHRMF